jgi:hypothetical protein
MINPDKATFYANNNYNIFLPDINAFRLEWAFSERILQQVFI